MNDVILETERLILRKLREDDLDFIVELWTDEDLMKYTGGPRDKNALIKNHNEELNNTEENEFDLWFVVLKKTNETIGNAGVLLKEIDNETFHEINYFIAKKHQNSGYATEVSKALLIFMKEKKGINEFVAIIDGNNTASKRVAEKIGMKYWKTVKRNEKEKEIYKT